LLHVFTAHPFDAASPPLAESIKVRILLSQIMCSSLKKFTLFEFPDYSFHFWLRMFYLITKYIKYDSYANFPQLKLSCPVNRFFFAHYPASYFTCLQNLTHDPFTICDFYLSGIRLFPFYVIFKFQGLVRLLVLLLFDFIWYRNWLAIKKAAIKNLWTVDTD
jgi:hypothetical protein